MDAIEGLKRAYANLNYYQFCEYLDLKPDDYAEELFTSLRGVAVGLGRFDEKNLAKLAAYRPTPTPAGAYKGHPTL